MVLWLTIFKIALAFTIHRSHRFKGVVVVVVCVGVVVVVCGGVWWCVVVCGGVWLCVVVCGGVWW